MLSLSIESDYSPFLEIDYALLIAALACFALAGTPPS
jgi:hypothetical protein